MPDTIDDLAAALMGFNGVLPRPGIGPLFLSEPFDLTTATQDEYWPYSSLPGVYVVYDAEKRLIYIGKASCGQALGNRLSAHFNWANGGALQTPEGWEQARFVRTIPVPRKHAFEAPAIEEYLLGRLDTVRNRQGQ